MTPIDFFSEYMRVVGVPRLSFEPAVNPALQGKRLGIINGSDWIQLWCHWYGRELLPGVKIVNVGNAAVQLNFMQAHRDGLPVPPPENIECFRRYARDLYTLYNVDAIMISCSTMNRAYRAVRDEMLPYRVPVFTIDRAMMEAAVTVGGDILVVATHGPTVASTAALLDETAMELNRPVRTSGVTVHEAFTLLGNGNIAGHNEAIARAIRRAQTLGHIDVVVLAQLSMAVFSLSYPDPVREFGIPVLDSAHAGFEYAGRILSGISHDK